MLACRGKKRTDEEREYTKVGARGEFQALGNFSEIFWIMQEQ